MTNGDKIRKMSNEEIARLFDGNCHYCLNYINCDGDLKKCEEGCIAGIKAYLDMEEE